MNFHEVLKSLNPKQLEAVKTIEGPVILVAGPGSGKTYTLTARIANILKETDAHPSNILALTFTDNAASNMRNKLREFIGSDAYKVKLMTFHAFCNEVIQRYPDKFGFSGNSRQITDLEKIRLIEQFIDELELEHLTTFSNPHLYKNDIIKSISDLKREAITADELEDMIKAEQDELDSMEKLNPRTNKPYGKWLKQEKIVNKNTELLKIYRHYQEYMEENELYDYDDMILFVTERFEKDEELLANFQEQYLYILVDEFQDTNGAQSRILELLGSFDRSPNIFVVGDDDQSIYRFQGANVENMFEFIKQYPETKIITLNQTYRCPQKVLDGARSLIKYNKTSLENQISSLNKNLKSTNKTKSFIEVKEFETADQEELYVLEEVKTLIKNGVNPSEIAVLYRNHKDAANIKQVFLKSKVAINIQDRVDILENEYVKKFINLLKTIASYEDDQLLFEILNYDFFQIDRLLLFKLAREAYSQNKNLWDLLQERKENDIINLKNNIINWNNDAYNMHLVRLLEKILYESGLLDYLKNKHDIDALNALISLFQFSRNISMNSWTYTLPNLLNDLKALQENRLSIAMDYTDNIGGVNFMTVHRAKGLEFEYVFIIKLNDRVWGNRKVMDKIPLPGGVVDTININKMDPNEEERRLLYVGLTRAKKSVILTYPQKSIEEGKERSLVRSQFISEISQKALQTETIPSNDSVNTIILEQVPPLDLTMLEKEYLKSQLAEFKLSLTSLNCYIDSPRNFLYEYIIKLPKVKSKELILGTVIHALLERFNRDFVQKKTKELSYYLGLVDLILKREYLIESEATTIKTEAENLFSKYFEILKTISKPCAEVEFNFKNRNIALDSISLTGKIDKLEWIDKSKRYVKITDYKTSRPRSRNEILGKTKSSDGKLLRQLQFYKMLIELDDRFDFIPVEFEIAFIKPDSRGNIKSEIFTADKIDTERIRELVRQAYLHISSLHFDEPVDLKEFL